MTNIINFCDIIRDESTSSSSSEELPLLKRSSVVEEEEDGEEVISPTSVLATAQAIDSWKPLLSGVNQKASRSCGIELTCDSSRRFSSNSVTPTPHNEGEILVSPKLKCFSYKEMALATKNFSPDGVLKERGFGSVFKGWIEEQTLNATKPGRGIAIAIKRLYSQGLEGHTDWLAAVNCLGRLIHPNLVRLFGYCLEQHLLVFEFMPRGSLENHLFTRDTNSVLSWTLRLRIALGVAKGLAFLHSSELNPMHRDLRTSNILLDSNYNAKFADFGFVKSGSIGDYSHVSARETFTCGNTAPEYVRTGHMTTKVDVYSFGVVFLEIISGRRAFVKFRRSGAFSLVEWAKPYLNNKLKIFRVVDSHLSGQYSQRGAQKAANLIFRCLSTEAKFRPNMHEIVEALEELQECKDT